MGSLLLLRVWSRSDAGTGLECVFVVVASYYSAALLLSAHETAGDPFVLDDFVQCGSLFRVNFKHSTNDMPAFPREQA